MQESFGLTTTEYRSLIENPNVTASDISDMISFPDKVYRYRRMGYMEVNTWKESGHWKEDINGICMFSISSSENFGSLTEKIKTTESRINELTELRKQLRYFARTKDTFDQYKKIGCSRKFFEAHRGDITIYKAAREALKKYRGHPPKAKDISAELEVLFAEKKDLYSGYKAARDDCRKLQEAKRNVDMFLQHTTASKDKQRERTAPVR